MNSGATANQLAAFATHNFRELKPADMEEKLSNRARGAIKHVKELEDLQMKMEVKVFITLAHTVEMEVVDMGVKTFARAKKNIRYSQITLTTHVLALFAMDKIITESFCFCLCL